MKNILIVLWAVPSLLISGNATLGYVKKANATGLIQAATVSYQLDTGDSHMPSVTTLVALGYLDKSLESIALTQ